jgi:hypothetical protein
LIFLNAISASSEGALAVVILDGSGGGGAL